MSYFKTLKTLIEEKIIQNNQLNSEGAFCHIAAEYLSDSSLISNFQPSPYYKENDMGRKLKIDGFSLNDNGSVLSLFIADYNHGNEISKLNLKDVENQFKQLYRVLNYIIKPVECDLPKANILSELNKEYRAGIKDTVVKIDFYLLTNNLAVNKKEVISSKIITKNDDDIIDYNFRICDINELERLHKNNQKLDIDVEDFYDKPINVLKPHIGNASYGTAITILPGKFLYNIYSEFKGQLLESNVRSFLSSRVKINKGIKDTLINNPEMFLAYNNGLCVTVSEIELNTDNSVKTFKDFQIVNGGQTTSSIFFATQEAKKSKIIVDLDKVNVMAKITEIRRNIDSVKIQSTIAKNSNLQNAVKQSDLSSNEEYLINLHSCSKKYRNPATNDYYYFERTRGQYSLEKNLSKNERQFLNLFPQKNKLEKADLSILYFCAFGNKIEPYISVQSAEKRYNIIKGLFDSENKKIGEQYFINLAGSSILYKLFRTKYGVGKNAIGRVRKNVISYSIGLLQDHLKKENKTIDFKKIWNSNLAETIDDTTVKNFLKYVNDILLQYLDDGRLDEACKKKESWDIIANKVQETVLVEFLNNIPSCAIIKLKASAKNFDIDSKYELMVKEMNKVISTASKYVKLADRVENEIETYMKDGMSLYSRRHFTLMKNHFNPNKDRTSIAPKTYKLYLSECSNKNGEIIKRKFIDLKTHLDDLYRVFNAILKDELLNI